VQYAALCYPEGGIVDDLTVYRLAADEFMLVVNASNIDKDWTWVTSQSGGRAEWRNASEETALLAVQGPKAEALVGRLADRDVVPIGYYRFARGAVAGVPAIISRTGYTGEDGFELFCAATDAVALWEAVTAAGEPFGLRPCGLAARDTLRLEAGMPLYGNELGRDVNPYEANLGRVVKLEKGDFVGRDALAEVARTGPRRRLVGLVMRDEGIARHGYPVVAGEGADATEPAGEVTSGSLSPTLGERIAMAFVGSDLAEADTPLAVMIRDRRCRADRVVLPFYRRPRPAEDRTT
jgi:aminomethyltransferase